MDDHPELLEPQVVDFGPASASLPFPPTTPPPRGGEDVHERAPIRATTPLNPILDPGEPTFVEETAHDEHRSERGSGSKARWLRNLRRAILRCFALLRELVRRIFR
jgi:hypothetical protein